MLVRGLNVCKYSWKFLLRPQGKTRTHFVFFLFLFCYLSCPALECGVPPPRPPPTLHPSKCWRSNPICTATCALSSMASYVCCVCIPLAAFRASISGQLHRMREGISMQILLLHYLLPSLFVYFLLCSSSSILFNTSFFLLSLLFAVWCFMLDPSYFLSYFVLSIRCCFSGLVHVLSVIFLEGCDFVNQSHT